MGGKAEGIVVLPSVYLDDHPVYLVGVAFPLLLPLPAVGYNLLYTPADLHIRKGCFEAESVEKLHRSVVGFRIGFLGFHVGDLINHGGELSLGYLGGVLESEGSGGGVSGVGKGGESLLEALLVQASKLLPAHEHLTPQLYKPYPEAGELSPQGNAPDRPQIRRYVLPGLTVPPRCPPDEEILPVEESYTGSIVFGLHAVLHPLETRQLPDASVEVPELLLRVSVVQREHGGVVPYGGKRARYLAGYPLGG